MAKKEYDIFISYSRYDMAVADKICAALDNVGITYFIDRQGISGGLEFPELLAENIISSKLFLFLASKHSYGSKFTNNEITFAFNEKPKNTILPYIIDGSQMPNTMRFIFSGINWRTIENHPIETTLIDDLLNLLGRERVPEQSQIEVKTNNIKNRKVYINRNLLVSISFIILVSFSLWLIPLCIIHAKYDNVYSYRAGRLMVELQGLKGFVNDFGIEVIPCKYDDAYDFNEGLARVKLNGKYGFVDKIGKEIIPLKYDNAYDFNEDLACVELNDKYGFVDKIGKEIIPLKYDYACSFREGWACVSLNRKYGFVDKTGKEVIPSKYDDICLYGNGFEYGIQEGLVAVKLDGKWGFIDTLGKEVIPLKYDDANPFREGLACVKLNDKYGFVDKTGKEIIPLKYDDLAYSYFNEGRVKVRLDDKWFYIDKNGNRIE